jgi:hypothetical protein
MSVMHLAIALFPLVILAPVIILALKLSANLVAEVNVSWGLGAGYCAVIFTFLLAGRFVLSRLGEPLPPAARVALGIALQVGIGTLYLRSTLQLKQRRPVEWGPAFRIVALNTLMMCGVLLVLLGASRFLGRH